MAAVSQHSTVFTKFTSMATTFREAFTSLDANKGPASNNKQDLTKKAKEENVKLRETVAYLESRLNSMNVSLEPSVEECSLVSSVTSKSRSIDPSNLDALVSYPSCKSMPEPLLPNQAAREFKRPMLKYADVEERSEKAEKEVSMLRAEKASVVRALEHAQNDNSSLRLSVSEAEKEVERIQSENDDLLDLIQNLHEECAEFRKRADEAERLAHGLQFKMNILEEALEDYKEAKDSAEERAFMMEQRVIELVENEEAREIEVQKMLQKGAFDFQKTEQSNSNPVNFKNAIEVGHSEDKTVVPAVENTRPPLPFSFSSSLMPQQVQRMVPSRTAEEYGNGLDQLIQENNKLKMELQRSGLMCHQQQELLSHLSKERGEGKDTQVVQKNDGVKGWLIFGGGVAMASLAVSLYAAMYRRH